MDSDVITVTTATSSDCLLSLDGNVVSLVTNRLTPSISKLTDFEIRPIH